MRTVPTPLAHTGGDWTVDPDPTFPTDIVTPGREIIANAYPMKDGGFEIAKGNTKVLALAPTAPHVCTDPACPGDLNRRKLDAFEAMRDALRYIARTAPQAYHAEGSAVVAREMERAALRIVALVDAIEQPPAPKEEPTR